MKLFSKEKALHLVDNPTKVGFSWSFFFAGIAVGYLMHKQYGDSYFVIMIAEKYAFIAISLISILPQKWIIKRVKSGAITRDSTLLYWVLPFGYVATFSAATWFSHMLFAIFLVNFIFHSGG